jgi:hypothetical protein
VIGPCICSTVGAAGVSIDGCRQRLSLVLINIHVFFVNVAKLFLFYR